MNERHVLYAQLILSKYFTTSKSRGPFLAHDVITHVKTLAWIAKISIRKAEIREARKRLKIMSKCVNDVYLWTWTH